MIKLKFFPNKIIKEDPVAVQGSLRLYIGGVRLYTWKALSGGHGLGTLLHGSYRIDSIDAIEDTEANKAYKREGFPWFMRIQPMFKTYRTALGVHPEGNVLGTLGCIGLLTEDGKFFKILKSLITKSGKIILEVY